MGEREINLVVVSHPDDEVLGFGGTGVKIVEEGGIVQPIVLCGGVSERKHRPAEADLLIDILGACKVLGFNEPVLGEFPNIRMNTVDHIKLVKFIEKQILNFSPSTIFTHHPGDLNDDHVQTSRACLAASRLFQRSPGIEPLDAIYYMEIMSSTDWAFPGMSSVFTADTFSDITETIERKIHALTKYKEVMRPAPHPRSEEIIRGQASFRGGQCGYLFAEAFQTAFRRKI